MSRDLLTTQDQRIRYDQLVQHCKAVGIEIDRIQSGFAISGFRPGDKFPFMRVTMASLPQACAKFKQHYDRAVSSGMIQEPKR